ncbi:unnamed protein product [Paramecium primaurelia]|uniref:Anaphase-promoting complex subunit 4 WD40 domain-containing protein n=1 Tax=Paramecium primaurelia TaxID=5886 RepID=A0A8S1LPP1_PARPR|nr:unnamed protein product [Paramecium primaurelia]
MKNYYLNSSERGIKKVNNLLLYDQPETVYGQLLLNQTNPTSKNKKQFKEIQPLKLLDAPNVTQNSEYQLLDWSSQEIIFLGLKENLFARNFKTGITQLLTQLEDGILTSLCSQGELIVYSTSNGDLIVIDSDQKQLLQSYQLNDITRMICFNDCILCCATVNNGILYIDLRQNKYIYRIGTMVDIYSVSLNDNILAAGSPNKVCIYDIRKPQILIAQYNQDGRALTWDKRKQNYLCAGGLDQTITIWNTEGEYNPHRLSVDYAITQIVSTNTQLLYCAGNKCYNSNIIMNRHQDKVLRIATSTDQTQLCSLGADELLIFWSLVN